MLNVIDGRSPPILMAVGDNDAFVDTRDTLATAARIREKGGSVRSIIYPRLQHDDTRDAIAGIFSDPARPVANDVFTFLRVQGIGRKHKGT
jgi:acetyl esterase/lipase